MDKAPRRRLYRVYGNNFNGRRAKSLKTSMTEVSEWVEQHHEWISDENAITRVGKKPRTNSPPGRVGEQWIQSEERHPMDTPENRSAVSPVEWISVLLKYSVHRQYRNLKKYHANYIKHVDTRTSYMHITSSVLDNPGLVQSFLCREYAIAQEAFAERCKNITRKVIKVYIIKLRIVWYWREKAGATQMAPGGRLYKDDLEAFQSDDWKAGKTSNII